MCSQVEGCPAVLVLAVVRGLTAGCVTPGAVSSAAPQPWLQLSPRTASRVTCDQECHVSRGRRNVACRALTRWLARCKGWSMLASCIIHHTSYETNNKSRDFADHTHTRHSSLLSAGVGVTTVLWRDTVLGPEVAPVTLEVGAAVAAVPCGAALPQLSGLIQLGSRHQRHCAVYLHLISVYLSTSIYISASPHPSRFSPRGFLISRSPSRHTAGAAQPAVSSQHAAAGTRRIVTRTANRQ